MSWIASPTHAVGTQPAVLLQLSLAVSPTLAFPLDAVLRGMVDAALPLEALCAYLVLTRSVVLDHVVRLGLATPPDRPLRKATPKGWTADDIHRLVAWRVAGVHPETISEHLDRRRSANAVRAKSRRLGLPVPPRKSLFRPKPEQLTLPLAGARNQTTGSAVKPGVRRSVVSMPTRIEDVDYNDLTWVGRIPSRRGRSNTMTAGISTNVAAVHAIGVVTCAAVDRDSAAELLGLSEPSYRTWRTRLGIPQIANKTAFTPVFDPEVGLETIKRNKLEIAASMKSSDGRAPHLFWKLTSERQVRLAPSERPRRHRGDYTCNTTVTVVTRDVLNAEANARNNTPVLSRTGAGSSAPVQSLLRFKPSSPGSPASPRRTTIPAGHILPSATFAMPRANLGG